MVTAYLLPTKKYKQLVTYLCNQVLYMICIVLHSFQTNRQIAQQPQYFRGLNKYLKGLFRRQSERKTDKPTEWQTNCLGIGWARSPYNLEH